MWKLNRYHLSRCSSRQFWFACDLFVLEMDLPSKLEPSLLGWIGSGRCAAYQANASIHDRGPATSLVSVALA